MELLLPCCGQSTRFPGTRPKFLLTHPNGTSMVRASIEGLDLSNVDNIWIIVLKKHVQRYQFLQGINQQFEFDHFRFVILDQPTQSQPETVYRALKQEDIRGPIAIKDCDNFFRSNIPNGNFVSVSHLQDHPLINPSNKSYVKSVTCGDIVQEIAEKRVISDMFSCGLYCFEYACEYLCAYEALPETKHLYISDIVTEMISDGYEFWVNGVHDYVDWGTLEDWNRYKDEFEVLFVDLDGVLVENSGEFFEPLWGTTLPIQKNVEYLQRRYNTGKVTIIITTSRSGAYYGETEEQLKKYNIPFDRLIMDLPHGRRCIINDYAHTNPYPSCYSINLPRNSDILGDLMK